MRYFILLIPFVFIGCARRQHIYESTANAAVWSKAIHEHCIANNDAVGAYMAEAMQVSLEPALMEISQSNLIAPDLKVVQKDGTTWGPTVTQEIISKDAHYARGISDRTAEQGKEDAIYNNNVRSLWKGAIAAIVNGVFGGSLLASLIGGGGIGALLLGFATKFIGKHRLLSQAFQKSTEVYKTITDTVKAYSPELYEKVIEPLKEKAKQELPEKLTKEIEKRIQIYKDKKIEIPVVTDPTNNSPT
jgi:hypothetical protein